MNNKKTSKASITVEASLVLPIFIFAMYVFIFFIQVISIQQEIQLGLLQTARFCEKMGYAYDYVTNYEDEEKNEPSDSSQDNVPQESVSREESSDENKSDSNVIDTREIATYLITSGLMQGKFEGVVDQHIINKSCVVGGMEGLNFLLSSYDEESNIADVTVQYKVHFPIGLAIIKDFY
ncbi:TadE family protein, partial [Anaerosporobacter sp.]